MKISLKLLSVFLVLTAIAACSSKPVRPYSSFELEVERVKVVENSVPGTESEQWVESMPDQIRVPAQLDPTGTYYRPSHKTIVEVIPGKFQKVEYPDDKEVKENEYYMNR